MADVSTQDSEANKIEGSLKSDIDVVQKPFGGLEFQVSEVVERLEASVNAQDVVEEDRRRESRKISTGFFEPEETSLDAILRILENLVRETDPSGDGVEPPLLPTDTGAKAAILSHSVAALLTRLERGHAARLGAHIASETTRWLSYMFKLPEYNAYYHQEQLEGLVRVTRMLLHHRYPRYLEDGALAFTSRLPCVYSSVASPLGVVQHLCRQLGLPLACVRPVPVLDSGRGMDVEALERLCTEDISSGREPLLVLAEAGAPPLGAGEALSTLSATCSAKGLHLHVRGHSLALAAAVSLPLPHLNPLSQITRIADSVTLTPGLWFGVPGLPVVTLYKMPEQPMVNEHSKSVSTTSGREGALAALAGLAGGGARLPALPLWTVLRATGTLTLCQRIREAFQSARTLHTLLSSAPGIRILSERPGGDELPNTDLVEAISGASACVAWQFAPEGTERPPPYYDKLNSWLGQVLQREADMITVEVCDTEAHGVVLRYCPLESFSLEDSGLPELASILESQLHVLHATVALRDPFREHVKNNSSLRLVHVPGWAGLGGVRYVPTGWEEAGPKDINSLNRQLVETLRATDSAFSCGDGDDGLVCVRFGMVTADTDVDELLSLVVSAGREVEESSKALSTMTEVLKKGIEEATADLERENAERLWQEGLLRRVPVVGRVVDWWSPASTIAPPGRRLHLVQGKLQTTEDIYKCVKKENTEEPGELTRAHSPARSQ